MFEKVNPSHPDKIADRIAGAIVDLAYRKEKNPKIAVEVLIGHGECRAIVETNVQMYPFEISPIVERIAGDKVFADCMIVNQDEHLAKNQEGKIRCGDNGIFKGVPVSEEEKTLAKIAKEIYENYPYDGKYIIDNDKLIICQSNAKNEDIDKLIDFKGTKIINPLGEWTGGTSVDCGATNRKLGSDMARSVTGGGLCLSGDTEYFGEDLKWHRIDQYKDGKIAQWNNGMLEFVLPNKYIVNKEKEEQLIHVYNHSKLSMCLTPEHEVLLKTSKNNLIKKPLKKFVNNLENGIGNAGYIIHNFIYKKEKNNEPSLFKTEHHAALQVAFCADGTILNKNRWKGRIRVKKQYKKERLRKILSLCEQDYLETQNGEYSIFWFNPPVISKSLYDSFKNENSYIWNIVVKEIVCWDGNRNNIFRTTIKEDADFIQFLFSINGDVATIKKDNRIGQRYGNNAYIRKSICYNVSKLKSRQTALRQSKENKINVSYTKGFSYCFNVPSHNLIVRHNDRIFITGNCGKDLSKADVSVNIYAFLKAQETGQVVELCCAIGDETIDGRPYEEIVEIARTYINSVGGFEKFAEWGLI